MQGGMRIIENEAQIWIQTYQIMGKSALFIDKKSKS